LSSPDPDRRYIADLLPEFFAPRFPQETIRTLLPGGNEERIGKSLMP